MDDNKPNEPKNDDEAKILPEVDEKKLDQKTEDKNEVKYDVSHAPTPHVVHVKKSPTKKILIGILVVALIGACGYLGYAYLQEKDNAKNLQQQIDISQSLVEQPQESEPIDNSASQSVYTAEVGKFTLSLEAPYAIIKRLDGGFEGGPATKLDIGTILEGSEGVIGSSIAPTAVYASPSQDTTLEDFISSRNDGFENVTELESIKVDGVTAKVYRLSGLFDINRVYFENDSIIYEFEAIAPESANELAKELQAVIAGFKFN